MILEAGLEIPFGIMKLVLADARYLKTECSTGKKSLPTVLILARDTKIWPPGIDLAIICPYHNVISAKHNIIL